MVIEVWYNGGYKAKSLAAIMALDHRHVGETKNNFYQHRS